MAPHPFPPLALPSWQPTRDALHAYARLLGKIRRALTPPQKHWWHVSLRVDVTGLTTTPMPTADGTVALGLDLVDHVVTLRTSGGGRWEAGLAGHSAESFATTVLDALAAFGIRPTIDRAQFADSTPLTYVAADAARYLTALVHVDQALKGLRHTFRGESSPVQLWPHHFDLSVVWFSGRLVPGQDPADPEYADEQMNFGFATGDAGVPEPYFYVTAYPWPDGLDSAELPPGAYWNDAGWRGAVLPYRHLVADAAPRATLDAFLHAVHAAGSARMRRAQS